ALLIVFGLGVSVTSAGSGGDLGAALGHLMPAVLATVPAVWVCVGLALVFFGALPRLVTIAWALLAAFLVVGEFGSLLRLPAAITDLSPFAHGSVVPGGTVYVAPLAVLVAVAAVLALTAVAAFRRRALTTA
ncbi:MAG: polyketide antibiotic transporter, partial [Micrococcales bacterium]|nr:polyketide antibiotic transporter [Micrococcales bacterium]